MTETDARRYLELYERGEKGQRGPGETAYDWMAKHLGLTAPHCISLVTESKRFLEAKQRQS